MENITMIAAIGKNRELGLNNKLIWHLKEDMQFFKENTMGKPIIMGRKTLESLPHLLPGRKHIVLTHQNLNIDNVVVYNDINQILELIYETDIEYMVIGGESIYKLFLPYADTLLLTEIDAEHKADAYFPEIDEKEWDKTIISEINDEKIKYKHLSYRRRIY